MNWLIGLAGLALADAWIYFVLLMLWQFVRAKLLETDWEPAVWELRHNPAGSPPLGRPRNPETGQLIRDTWEPVKLPNPFAIVRDGKVFARFIKSDPKWTIGTVLLWYVPELVALALLPALALAATFAF